MSYNITFKLSAVLHAEIHGNRAAARDLGINEKQIRDWRSKKLNLMSTNFNAKRLKGAGRQSFDLKREQKPARRNETETQEKREELTSNRVDVEEKAANLVIDEELSAPPAWLKLWRIEYNFSLKKTAERDLSFMSSVNQNKLHRNVLDVSTVVKMTKGQKESLDRLSCASALLELRTAINDSL